MAAAGVDELGADRGEVTQLLGAWSGGDRDALDRLLPLVYAELRRIAGRAFRREGSGHTLQPTAVAHEALLRLFGERTLSFRDRAHFFAVSARCMRRLLIDHARSRATAKRGGHETRVPFLEEAVGRPPPSVDVLAVELALEKLARVDPELERLVELRFFGGLSIAEVAEVTETSTATLNRDWRTARAFLASALALG